MLYLDARMKLRLLFLLLALLVASLPSPPISRAEAEPLAVDSGDIAGLIQAFSSIESRVTGYPGCHKAAEMIEEYFNNSGLNVTVHKYRVLVPVDEGSYVEVLEPVELRIKAYALWPNLVQPSLTPNGIEGRLVYLGKGRLDEFDGKELEGAIAVMDFDSGDSWITALDFGAIAVVFVGEGGNRYQAASKVVLTPLYAPRLYVGGGDGDRLVELARQGARARIYVNMRWREVEAENVIGVVKGTERPNEVIIVSAHYDSFSVVPGLSPGADEASSIAALLTLARYYASHRPPRTLWFVALSGHWEGLAGAREFVEDVLFSDAVQGDELKVIAQVNLYLSSDNDKLTALYVGHFYKYGSAGGGPEISSRYTWVKSILTDLGRNVLPKLGLPSSSLNDVLTHFYWGSTELEPFILDSEPAALSGAVAFTLMTSFTRRLYWWTPFDTAEGVNLDNICRQIQLANLIIDRVLSATNVPEWPSIKPTRTRLYATGGPASYITLRGKVVFFNASKGWYEPLPNAIVRIGINPQSNFYLPANILVRADSNGEFEVHGLPVAMTLSYRTALFTEGWLLDDESRIVFAPDLGIYGARAFSPFLSLWVHPENATVVVFECGTVELFDMLNPEYHRRAIIPDPTSSGDVVYLSEQARLMPYNLREYAEPLFYGAHYNPRERVGLVFMEPRTRFLVVLQRGVVKVSNVGIIANTTPSEPEGVGLEIRRPGERIRVTFTALKFAEDLYRISEARYTVLSSHFVSSPTAPEALAKAEMYIKLARDALDGRNYSSAYSYALAAWSWALAAYNIHVMPLIYDLTGTTVIFFSFLLPFAIFFERLVFRAEGLRRLLAVAMVAAIMFAGFSMVHPSIALMSNSALSLAGIVVLSFLVFALAVLSSETSKIVEEEATKRLGMHRFQRVRSSLIEIFSSVALESMRRYKLRTLLTLFTIFTITVALVSLTSSSNALVTTRSALPYEASYMGLLLKKGRSEPPYNVLDIYTAYVAKAIVGDRGVVCPRVRLWPSMIYPTGMVAYIGGGHGNATMIRGVLGVASIESKKLFSQALVGGRLFESYDYYACLLTSSQAKTLGVDVGDVVEWYGLRLLVVGILSTEVLNQLRDLDDLALTPLDPRTVMQYALSQTQARIAYPSSYDETLIVPDRLALDLGGSVWSIAVYFKEGVAKPEAEVLAYELARALDIPVYMGWEGMVDGYSRIVTWSLIGWNVMLVLLVLGGLNIVITLMAAVKERTRDIYIYSALGLPPRGAVVMFMAESFVYASLTVPLGYVAGIVLNYLLYVIGVLPSTYILNFSSISITLTLLVLISVILASSLYPALKASGLITPSLERRWRIPTTPRGDEWHIPLPVMAPSREEARAILLYLKEYLEGEGRATMYFTVLDKPVLSEGELRFSAALTPRELNITQEVTVRIESLRGRHSFSAHIRRLTGRYETWRTSNYYFVDSIRKQLLLWRSLKEETRKAYIEQILHPTRKEP